MSAEFWRFRNARTRRILLRTLVSRNERPRQTCNELPFQPYTHTSEELVRRKLSERALADQRLNENVFVRRQFGLSRQRVESEHFYGTLRSRVDRLLSVHGERLFARVQYNCSSKTPNR